MSVNPGPACFHVLWTHWLSLPQWIQLTSPYITESLICVEVLLRTYSLSHSTYCVHTRSVSFLIWCLNYWLVDVVARHSQRDAIVNTLTWKRRWQWQWLTIAMILLNIVARRLNRYIHRQYTAIETVGTPLLLLLLKMNMIRVVLSH